MISRMSPLPFSDSGQLFLSSVKLNLMASMATMKFSPSEFDRWFSYQVIKAIKQ